MNEEGFSSVARSGVGGLIRVVKNVSVRSDLVRFEVFQLENSPLNRLQR